MSPRSRSSRRTSTSRSSSRRSRSTSTSRRLERYLAMAWESGAQPVVLLTKTDLVDDVAPYLAEVETVTLGACPVLAVSAQTGDGMDALLAWFEGNRTAVLLGSSGVGKSTIVNALVGEEVLATQEVREDDQRGRHTTTRRELILLPGGRRRPRHARDPRAAALGRRPRADLRRRRGDRAALPLHATATTTRSPAARSARRSPTGRSRRSAGRATRSCSASSRRSRLRRNHLLRQERVREYKIRARANRNKKKR